jgi:hypothetical protein
MAASYAEAMSGRLALKCRHGHAPRRPTGGYDVATVRSERRNVPIWGGNHASTSRRVSERTFRAVVAAVLIAALLLATLVVLA